MRSDKKILVVGVGNTLRGDDGIGHSICAAIEAKALPGVTCLLVQQLQIELLEEFRPFSHVIIIDAAASGDAVSFYPVGETEPVPMSMSHQVNTTLLAALVRQLYPTSITMMVCAVKGEDFSMGEELSVTGQKNADEAIQLLLNLIDTTLS